MRLLGARPHSHAAPGRFWTAPGPAGPSRDQPVAKCDWRCGLRGQRMGRFTGGGPFPPSKRAYPHRGSLDVEVDVLAQDFLGHHGDRLVEVVVKQGVGEFVGQDIRI